MSERDELNSAGEHRFLIAALLLLVAKGDGNISNLESGRMVDILSSRLNVTYAQAMESLTQAVNKLEDDPDIEQTLGAIAASLTSGERMDVFSMVQDVADVDDSADEGESAAIAMASRVLGLS